MLQSRKMMLLLIVGIIVSIAACKKNTSSDDPLPNNYPPSVIIGSDNFVLYGVNPKTHARNWEYSMGSNLGGVPDPLWLSFRPSPVVYGDRVYQVAVNTDSIHKINAFTGALVAKYVLPMHPNPATTAFTATPLADNGILYFACTNDTLYAVDTANFSLKWKFGENGPSPAGTFLGAPVIYNNHIFIASTSGHVYCLDKTTGPDNSNNPIWDYPGVGYVFPGIVPQYLSSPCVSFPYLYVGSTTDSLMYCIYMNPPLPPSPPVPEVGVSKWTFKSNGAIYSSPTAYAGFVYFGSTDFNVYAVDTFTGGQQWKFHTSSEVRSSPLVTNNVLYVGSYDYNLYAINVVNGSQRWKFGTNGLIKSSPVQYSGNLYVGSYDGYLYAVDSSHGIIKWNFKIDGNIECSPVIEDYSGNQYNSGIAGFNTSNNIN